MALPATDDFNRTNGALGANWTGSVGYDLAISSNTCIGNASGDSSMYWSADTPDAAQYAQIVLGSSLPGYCGPLVRSSATDWVVLQAYRDVGLWDIEWYNGGSWTAIGSTYGTAPAAGNTGKITADGTTFKGYINTTERISGINTSAPASGYGGIYVAYNVGSVDNFEVGNLAAPPASSIAAIMDHYMRQRRRR